MFVEFELLYNLTAVGGAPMKEEEEDLQVNLVVSL